MRVLVKCIVSAMMVTALCAANVSGISANSDVITADTSVSAADVSENGNAILNNSSIGAQDGYYYCFNSISEDDEMELVSPSLFKAKWDSTGAEDTETTVFERGKQFGPGQGLNWTMESYVDYEMEFEAEGSFFVGTHISLNGPETEKYYSKTDIYIIDASLNWEVPEDAIYLTTRTGKGTLYSVYQYSRRLTDTGKDISEDIFYIVDRYAEDHGKDGRVSADYDIAPFIDAIIYSSEFESNSISVGINGGVSKGRAELVRNEIIVPDTPKFEDIHDYIAKRVYLDNGFHWTHAAQDYGYRAFGYDIEMKGYVGEPIKCKWEYYEDEDPDYSEPEFRGVYFNARNVYSSYSIIDHQGSMSFDDVDDLSLEYSVDIGSITKKTSESRWYIGADIQCMRDTLSQSASSDLLGNDPVSYINIYDKYENCNLSTDYEDFYYYAPVDMGTIESNGIEYNVWFMKAKNSFAYSGVSVIRKDELEPVTADNIPVGYIRYENTYSITDIFSKLKEVGLDLGGISEVEFTLSAYDTAGTAYLNHTGIKRTIPESKTFSAEDMQLLKDYILGKENESPKCDDYILHDYKQMDLYEYLIRMNKDYDLNGDGKWDIYDLCEMRKRISDYTPASYVKPDEIIKYGSYMTVGVDDLKLYSGPDESYEYITSIPKSSRIKEIGIQHNNDDWFFTEYNGNYGWTRVFKIDDETLTGVYDNYDYKPVIYLYPEEETDVHVELELTESELYTTYPKYNNGWDVTAYPDGSLLNKADGTHHKYLFWDSSNCRTRYDFSKGFCVAGSDTESFLKEKLTYLGLTEEELNEFIIYWLPLMEHNKYNLITFQGDAYTNSAKLDISPQPDSMLRIFMVYVPLDDRVDIEPQQLETFERNGFTVVEWGGSVIKP